ncbi:alpha-N-arabinofuranosidase [Microbacterium sp. P5_E9]
MITIAEAPSHHIDRRVYGQFAEHLGRCVYEGLWVGSDSSIRNKNGIRSDVIEALRAIKVPVVRWPGGCFADEYHWLKGVGPERQSMVNTHWGGVVEPNTFGTHEYFELLHQLDAEAYVNGNVGSGTVPEMADWVEYMTLDTGSPMADLRKRHGRDQAFRLEFFGVGNESWGCGGNMLPLHYANLYRQYQTYVRKYGEHSISKIACGANSDDYEWTEVLMARAAGHMDGLSLHYYTLPTGEWDVKGAATGFDDRAWHETIRRTRYMDELLTRHGAIMDRHDPAKRVSLIVDEWGTWYDVEPGTETGFLYQQNTIRDAVAAAINLHIFHKHASRVRMANIAQMVNVLQSMLLTDGPRLVKTPTYHVFDLYSDHQDAEWVDAAADHADPFLDWTVSRKDGTYTISVVNTGLEREAAASFRLPSAVADVISARVLVGETSDAHNTFDAPDVVSPVVFSGYQVQGDTITVTLPARAVVSLRVTVAG